MAEDANEADSKNQKWRPCPECGSHNVKKNKWKIALVADVVCQDCGHKENAKEMHRGRGSSESEKADESTESSESGLSRSPHEKLNQNLGMFLIVGGILVSLTIVGAIIGIPMIIIGMLISSKGGPDMDEIEFSCPECGAELEHDTKVCPECGEDGLRLDKSRSLK